MRRPSSDAGAAFPSAATALRSSRWRPALVQRGRGERSLEGTRSHRQQPLDQGEQRHSQRASVVRVGVDRADLLAHVAAEDPVADGVRLPAVERAGVLDGQIADAATRIDRARRDQRSGRAAAQAPGAGSARGAHRSVRRKLGRGQDRSEEDPGAGALVREQVRVLSDPAQPGPRGQRPFGQRPIVDVGGLSRPASPMRAGRRRGPRACRAGRRGSRCRSRSARSSRPARPGCRPAPAPAPRAVPRAVHPNPRARAPTYGAATVMTERASGSWRRGSVACVGRAPAIQPMRPIRPAATLASIRSRSSGSGSALVTPTRWRP